MPRYRHRTTRRLSLQVLDDRRVLAAIAGSVFDDTNDSLRREIDESGLESRLVYIDQNDNSKMDQGEQYALTDAAGNFSIENLTAGDYSVRLFSGTQSQIQTTPNTATMLHDAVLRSDITTAVPAMVLDEGTPNERTAAAVLASGNSLQSIAADGTLSDRLEIGGEVSQLMRLSDGSLIVFADTSDGSQAWVVDDALTNPVALGTGGPEGYILSAGGDDVGRGVIVSDLNDDSESELWAFDRASSTYTATGRMVPLGSYVTGDTTPRSTDGPTRSVISHATYVDDGNGDLTESLAISLWSNADASMLGEPIVVTGASSVVAFNDEAGLLVLQTGENLTVYDVDNHLANLYTILDTEPVAAIDGPRGLIVTLSPRSFGVDGSTANGGLRLIDSETGSVITDMPIALSALDDLNVVALDSNLRSVMVVGGAGLAQLSLRNPTAARVAVSGDQTVSVSFGVQLIGTSTVPLFTEPPVLSTAEDSVLSGPLPGLVDISGGANLVVLPLDPPQHGTATIGPDGQIDYTPDADFEGSDSLTILVGDGRDFTVSTVRITVTPVPDAPTGVTAAIDPLPENTAPSIGGLGTSIGSVGVIDVDTVNHFGIEILDLNHNREERFEVHDLKIYYVGPEPLDAETEWLIPIIVSVDDPESGGKMEFLTALSILDADDPITDITPDEAAVPENSPGETVTGLSVVDQDLGQYHELTVDDDRFEIVSNRLKLKDDVSLDYEAEKTITINVTASHEEDSFTKALTLNVIDVAETPEILSLSNETVPERQPAAVVGELSVDGNPAANGHSLTVNDSRFVIDGSTLRLADDTFVESTPGIEDEIVVEITATPLVSGAEGITQNFVIAVIGESIPFHNGDYPEDVNRDEGVTAVDALAIINYLNAYGAGPVGEGNPAYGYDVNSDGYVTSLDALLVVNELNAITTTSTGTVGNEPNGEPEPNSRKTKTINRDADDPVVLPPSQSPQAPSLQRSVPRELAIASFANAIDTKSADTSTHESIDAADVVISAASPPSPDDATRADEVFGESEIDLLG